jgi:HAMP domain-containing protein
MVTDFAERIIEEKARSVAAQVAIYLQGRQGQESKREPLSADPVFKKISVQKVGLTGYTALYERPGSDGIWRTWAHVNPAIIGIDMSTLSKTLGRNFPGFWNVYTRVQGGKESRGYYTWQDKDGTFREKFMVCTPVEGTPFVIAATTYLDEFTKDVKNLQGQSDAVTRGTRHMTFAILGATLLLIGGIVSLYGHALTKRIKDMTRIAERISVGDLEAEIRTGSRDEIGALGEAISRMQESIRLSLERLRRAR